MNTLIQNILVFSALALALVFLLKKFFFKSSKAKKDCDGGDNCGCH
jgi:hypothetical protein